MDELKAARAIHRSDPGKAASMYRGVIARYPRTPAARQAQQYLDELKGG